MDSFFKVVLIIVAWSAPVLATHFWHENNRNKALAEMEKDYGAKIEEALQERDKARSQAWAARQKLETERSAIAESNPDVASWANQPVPAAVAERVCRAARRAGAEGGADCGGN